MCFCKLSIYYKTNHIASLCLCVCANAPRLSNSYLTSSIRIYIPQVFFEWYILSITISNTDTAEAKAKRKNRISRKMSHFVTLLDRCYWCRCRFFFLISKSNTHVYICVRIRKMFASLRLSLYFGGSFSFFSMLLFTIYI